MRSVVIALGLALCATQSIAGTTGNGWTQGQSTTPAADPATPVGPYTLDAKGSCHAANGQLVEKGKCAMAATPIHCRNSKTGKFAKCGTPDAEPAP